MAIWKIFVGGAADNMSEIVKSYELAYAKANPDFSCRYFSWQDRADIRALLNGEAKDGAVSLIGHSYGGDTAFWLMGEVPKVDLLVTIDPVGRFRRDWGSIRAGARVWLNVRAEPDDRTESFGDAVAWLGRRYGRPPAGAEAPNYSFFANRTHGDFAGMMRGTVRGVSGRMLVGGRVVG